MPTRFVGRQLFTAAPDNALVDAQQRVGRYADAYGLTPLPARQVAADEGSYYTITNPTPATGVQLNANINSFTDTNAFIVCQNGDSASNPLGRSAYLDKMTIIPLATLPTGCVAMHFAFRKGTTSRRASTGANETEHVPVNMRKQSGRVPSMRVFVFNNAGAYTIPASVASVDFLVGRCVIPTGPPVVGDEYMVHFGTDDHVIWQGGAAVRATDPARRGTVTAPIVVDPGEFLAIHMWWVTSATTAATFEYSLSWMER